MKKVKSLTLTPFSTLVFLLFVFSTFVYASTPIADYHLDECGWSGVNGEVKNSSSNEYNGVAEGSASTIQGKLCKAGSFTSNGDKIRIKNFPNLTTNFSITAWFKTKNPAQTGQRIFIDDNSPNSSGYALSLGDDGYKHVRLYHRNDANDILDTTYQIEADKWYFVAGVFDTANKIKHIYLYDSDGVLLEHIQKSYTIDLKRSNNDAFIGGVEYSNTSDTYSFNGSIDEVKVFKTNLSEIDIEKIVDNEKDGKNYDGTARDCPSCSAPVADYHLDECSWSGIGAEVKDSSGNGYNLTSQNGAETKSGGELCKSGDFGLNSKVSGTWYRVFNTKVSLVAWIKTSKNQQPYARVVEFSNSSGDYQHSTALAFDSTGKIIRGWTTGTQRSVEVSYNLKNHGYFDNRWHQIVYVYDGSTAKLYIDKKLKDSKNTSIGDIVDGRTLTISGYYSGISYYFTGQIDEVKIFDEALSSTRIEQIYDNEDNGRNWDGSLRYCSSCSNPIADYHLDECSWDGTNDEVKDSSGNGHDGTAVNGANTEDNTTVGGGLFRVGNFNNSLKQRVEIGNSPKLKGSRTITSWIRVTEDKNGRIFADDKNNKDGDYALSYRDPGSKRVRFYIRGLNPVSLDSNAKIELNRWYFVVARFDANSKKKYLFIYDSNGNKIDSVSQTITGSLKKSEGYASIGGELSSGSESNGMQFDGQIDEVKIFGDALSDGEIDSIYDNEKDGKNWDGSSRDKPCCGIDINSTTTPLEFEGSHIVLNVTTNPPHWTHVDFNKTFSSVPVVFTVAEAKGDHPASVRVKNISTTGFDAIMAEPQGEDGPHLDQNISFLAVNKGLHKIGNTYFQVGLIDTKKYQQASKGVNIHNDWEKISTIFSSCDPTVVANIQSFKNERGLDIPNSSSVIRSIPWMTTAIDVNNSGVYLSLERSETDEGNISQNETIGYMIAPSNIQDSVIDDNDNNISFETIRKKNYFVGWDNSCKEVSFVNTYNKAPLIAANKNSKNEMDGGWFRRCALSKTEVGFQIDEDGSIYSKTIYDYNSTYQDTERRHIAETGGIFAFSDTIVIHENPQNKNFKFDAWDENKGINNRKISTKIVKKDFNLTIASLDENGTNYQDFNGTVCASIDNNTLKLLFTSQNSSTITFNINKALKDIQIHISWKKDTNENCPLSNEDNETNSTDNFAIRPDKFDFNEITPQAYAGDNFQVKFEALDALGNDAANYNESKDISFAIDSNISKPLCYNGALHVNDFSFANGLKNIVDANYSDIGDVNITIKEKLGSEFALVDNGDTSEADRLITPASKIISVLPYELNVTNVDFSTSTGANWLYMSDINSSYQNVKSTIQANDKAHNIVQNFTASCYAKDIDVTHNFYVLNPNNGVKLTYDVISGTMLNSSKDISDINKTIKLPASLFLTSKVDVNYRFNIDRDFKKPYSPVIIGLRNIKINTATLAKVENNASNDSNTTFYYGRVKTKDINTNKQSSNHNMDIEVYSTLSLPDFHQNSLNWYNMKEDNITKIIDFLPKKDFSMNSDKSGINDINSTQSITGGIVTFTITNSWINPDSAYIHIKIPPYLWYSRYNSYDDNSSSNCGSHPCFKYNYLLGNQKSIKSGNFNGTNIGNDYNASKVSKKGVKVFR